MNARIPRYYRIAETLREKIRDGVFAPGVRLDNQRQLAKSFGVTLMTLRQALAVLERENLIARRHGLGTFVAAPSIDYDILQLRRFTGDLHAQGEAVATRVLGSRFVLADRHVTDALGVGPAARVFVLERLRLVGDRPLGLQRSYLPRHLGEDVARADLATTPLSEALEFKLGVTIVRAQETVSAVRLGRREARELGCPSGAAAFESERVSFDAAGTPIVFDRVFIPGDRFRITRELHYESHDESRPSRRAPGSPATAERWGQSGAISGPPMSKDHKGATA